QVFWSGTFGPQVALRAMESPASVFAALGVATALSLLIGVPATWVFGLKGAIWGSNAADVLSFIALLLMLRYKLGSKSLKSSESAPAEFSRNVALEVSD
ncbi:MAG TPA: hypothetical protein VMI06_01985, partial [Terriglobia bacterium]|nr:hypothetical protein [Terriglobia bacterium]